MAQMKKKKLRAAWRKVDPNWWKKPAMKAAYDAGYLPGTKTRVRKAPSVKKTVKRFKRR